MVRLSRFNHQLPVWWLKYSVHMQHAIPQDERERLEAGLMEFGHATVNSLLIFDPTDLSAVPRRLSGEEIEVIRTKTE